MLFALRFSVPRFKSILLLTLTFALGIAEAEAQKRIIHSAEKPLAPVDATNSMTVPDGFHTSLFAAEPDVMQPIGFCIDDRNRLWVAEAYNYPKHGDTPADRIVILEDSDGDGTHDVRKVFHSGFNYITGIEVGFGGVWVMSPPNMYFVADADSDDVPDAAPTVLLDGFGNHANAHNLANGFAWGPDGWLYATHGRTNWSMIGMPGAASDARIRFDGGVWRYHPTRHEWESVADGTTNPWGIDWNDYGDAFICNCVNPHLFQVIPGAHYEPWRGRKSSQYAFQRIDTIADHLHFVGLGNVRNGLGTSEEDQAGGGHAHCGTMIYLGDTFPSKYRNQLFTNNIHGKRINQETLKLQGSGYTASHAVDLMRSKDPWFMGVTLAYGSGGEVYVSDWSDTGECHSTRNTRRETGRIYRITYGDSLVAPVNLQSLSNAELTALQTHTNDWMVRHARRILQERHHANQDMRGPRQVLHEQLFYAPTIPQRLRGLWALHVTGGVPEADLARILNRDSPFLQQWAIRLCSETHNPSQLWVDTLTRLAQQTQSPRVRLELACTLQRLPLSKRWHLAEKLAAHAEDGNDQNLPLMLWYGIEPLIQDDTKRYVDLAIHAQIPSLRENIARRIALSPDSRETLDLLLTRLDPDLDSQITINIFSGLLKGYEGRRRLAMPSCWPQVSQWVAETPNAKLRRLGMRLALLFNAPDAIRQLTLMAEDSQQDTDSRIDAINALVSCKAPQIDDLLISLSADPTVRLTALNGLSAVLSPKTPSTILTAYSTYTQKEKQAALNALAATPASAQALLTGLANGAIHRDDVTAFTARQIEAHGDSHLSNRLTKLWGAIARTPKEQEHAIATHLKALTPEHLANANLENGRKLFNQHCGTCHQFFGEGGKVGPDLSGSQRNNLRYMLENIVSPNSSVAKDYQMTILRTVDGQVITGLLQNKTDRNLTIANAQGSRVIPLAEIEEQKNTSVSVMPTGLLDNLTERQIRDLFGYMQKY